MWTHRIPKSTRRSVILSGWSRVLCPPVGESALRFDPRLGFAIDPRSTPRRSGFTLIELLVVIVMFTGLASLTGTTLYFLMRSEKMVTQSAVTERSVSRLALQFRDDVHQSVSAQVVDDPTNSANEFLLTDVNGSQIRYRASKERLTRLVVHGDTTIAREDYRLPDCQVSFSASSDLDSKVQTLLIARPGATVTRNPHAPKPLRSLEIQAGLNRQQPNLRKVSPIADRESTEKRKREEE